MLFDKCELLKWVSDGWTGDESVTFLIMILEPAISQSKFLLMMILKLTSVVSKDTTVSVQ